jgi:hypothetical protein
LAAPTRRTAARAQSPTTETGQACRAVEHELHVDALAGEAPHPTSPVRRRLCPFALFPHRSGSWVMSQIRKKSVPTWGARNEPRAGYGGTPSSSPAGNGVERATRYADGGRSNHIEYSSAPVPPMRPPHHGAVPVIWAMRGRSLPGGHQTWPARCSRSARMWRCRGRQSFRNHFLFAKFPPQQYRSGGRRRT